MGMLQIPSQKRVAASRRLTMAVVSLVMAVFGGVASAQDSGVVIDVSGAKRGLYPIAIPVGVDSDGAAATMVADVATFDMSIAGFFKVLPRESFLADLAAEKLSIEPQKWKDVGAYGVMKFKVTSSGDSFELEFKLYEISKGANASLSKSYRGRKADLRRSVHAW